MLTGFFRSVFFCLLFCRVVASGQAGEITLPEGSAPQPLVELHFPSRLHEFIWRNWNLVEPAHLAKLLGTTVEQVESLAGSLGLPPAAPIPSEQKRHGYLTLIRRNWHLLPYEQLLELAEMTPERLDFILREEDFLWVKLGKLKPKCDPLRFQQPTEAIQRRAAEIRQEIREEFGVERLPIGEPRFRFFYEYRQPDPNLPTLPFSSAEQDGSLGLRIIYPYFAPYGDPLSEEESEVCPDGLLARLSSLKINGIWLHVVLRNLAPGGELFPSHSGRGCELRLKNLRSIVARAKRYHIRVFLYINEPRAMPKAFFQGREELVGVSEGETTAFCTSQPAVRRWLADSLAFVFREVPDLGGVITITASENLTNCASHGNWRACPHCKHRTDAEIIAEVNATIAEGVHRGNPKAEVLVWDWGWRWHGDGSDIIERLPKSLWLMSVSEWSLPIERGGLRVTVNEYSLSAVGPGSRALQHWRLAQQKGMKTAAKVQINNSWELGAVPYLPVMDLVAAHCRNLAASGVSAVLLSWSLGGYPSPNLEIAAQFTEKPTPSVDEVLDALAQERYGREGAPAARRAWTAFSTAFCEYPFDISVVYQCPVQLGPANLLYLEKTGYQATMTGFPYDDVDGWRGPYPAETFATQFEKMAAGWRSGVEALRAAVEKSPPQRREENLTELRFAEAAACHFQSVANQTRFILARNELLQTGSQQRKKLLREEMRNLLQSEIALARRLFVLANEDSRLGFEPANHYFYLPSDLAEKIINCRWLLRQLDSIEDNETKEESSP